MSEYPTTVIEAQPDYLTCSAHGVDAAANLHLWALARVHEQRSLGNRLQTFRLQGYEGQHCGAVEWGRRDTSAVLVRLIGNAADQHLGEALSLSDTCTRVDLAVTVRHTPPDSFVARGVYAMAECFYAEHPRSAQPWRVSDADGGDTTYVGKRGSSNMLRVYNKEAECIAQHDADGAEHYKACWRYELEVKSPTALPLAREVGERTDRPAYVQAYLWDWMHAHGLDPGWGHDGGRVLIPGFRRRSDADSRLQHLTTNVRPTVAWLDAHGYGVELRAALGLR